MNFISRLQFLSLLIFLFVSVANAQQMKIFISSNGNDGSGKGTKEQPYRTVYKAREEVRAIIAKGLTGDITVFLRGGKFYLDSNLIFRENDGGNDGYRITYCNYEKEKAFIVGGKPITNWKLDKGNQQLAYGVNELQGAFYESGLDNSSMYDGVHFDKKKISCSLPTLV